MPELIPQYPLAAVVFLGAGALFALQMARHLRVFATARPVTVTDRAESRFDALVRYALIQVRMFRDPASGMSHLVIFWGFVILSAGTVDRIFFGLVHDIVSAPLDGWLWRLLLLAQNLLIVGVLVAAGLSIWDNHWSQGWPPFLAAFGGELVAALGVALSAPSRTAP